MSTSKLSFSFLNLFVFTLAGCAISPVPKDIAHRKVVAHAIRDHVEASIEPGDLLFRQGHLEICGGLVEFGSLLKSLTGSKYTHVAIVYRKIDGEALVVDVGTHGLQRLFLVDWLTQDSNKFAVLRINLKYQECVVGPCGVIDNLRAILSADPIYDEVFEDTPNDFCNLDARRQARDKVMKRVYCSEPADWSFRSAGLPLADKVRIRDFKGIRRWPNRWFWEIVAIAFHIDTASRVALPGNQQFGLASSQLLHVVWSSDQTDKVAADIRCKFALPKTTH